MVAGHKNWNGLSAVMNQASVSVDDKDDNSQRDQLVQEGNLEGCANLRRKKTKTMLVTGAF